MLASEQARWLLACTLGVLVVATVCGQLIARSRPPSEVIRNLNQRIHAWWAMVAVFGLAMAAGPMVMILLFALVSFLSLREFLSLTPTRPRDHLILVLAFYLVLPLQFVWIAIGSATLFALWVPVLCFLALPALAALRGDATGFLGRVASIQWAMMACIFCLSHAPGLLLLQAPGQDSAGLFAIAFLVIVAQSSDVLQYIWGKLTGRHAMAPGISPSKTWEGLVGGVASATLLGTGLWWITPFPPAVAGGMALLICLAGALGGLVMSAVKRDRGAKDWGNLIQGHGGMLDRADSLIFSAPVFFCATRAWQSL